MIRLVALETPDTPSWPLAHSRQALPLEQAGGWSWGLMLTCRSAG